jgi:ABC-type antimicrobial peptide transport system permease subunit
MILAAIGIYGVIAYAVTQRTHEFGVRTALGASAADVLQMVLRSGMTLAAIGLAIGIPAALAVMQFMSSMLFGVGPRDPFSLGLAAGLLAVVALVACWIPARRAARVDPAIALRYE